MDVGTPDNPGADTPRRANRSRRIGRRRGIVAVVCLVMGVLVSVAGVVSGSRGFGYTGDRTSFGCTGGAVGIHVRTEGSFRGKGWNVSPEVSSFSWNRWIRDYRSFGWLRHDWSVVGVKEASSTTGYFWGILISLWFLAAVFLLTGTGLAFSARRSIRRARIGLCVKCCYDLRGLPASAPCPECGKVRVVGVATGDEGKGGS